MCSEQIKAPGDESRLLRELCAKIRFSGPITVADYMREVNTNPVQGVYMAKNALGADGHFITSPEISQMFGECIGIWLMNEWMKMGSPSHLQIVELGPGRATLINDILRTFCKLRSGVLSQVSVHLVEVSPELKKIQLETLAGVTTQRLEAEQVMSKYGGSVCWHESLRTVPKGFSLFLAHEFFDALPVHKFVRTAEGWREILIDIDPDSKEPKLRYIRSRNETPSCILIDKQTKEEELELCPQAGLITRQISERIVAQGGICLLVDYGGSGQKDTFRAFRKHNQVDPLDLPGTADLTADVDFTYLSKQVIEDCYWYGPITQRQFLHATGIGIRCEQLVKGGEDIKVVHEAYQALTNEENMGTRFKFACMFPKAMKPIHDEDPPVGFQSLNRNTEKQ